MDCVCTVLGAGVVGMAVARALSKLYPYSVLVLDSLDAVGKGTSSRNSGVIHAGIYYRPGSLKANLCVEGNKALYAFCEESGVPIRRCGKLIVATQEDQHPKLEELARRAAANGAGTLRWLSPQDVKQLEPEVTATGGLFSPSTGIVDTHALILALQGEAEADGATVVLNAPVTGGHIADGGGSVTLHTPGLSLKTGIVVNCAGLHAASVTASVTGLPAPPLLHYAKGSYFALRGGSAAPPIRHLVYPAPERGGLGVHATLDLGGAVRFGPDVEWLSHLDEEASYSVDASRAPRFYDAVRRYWPALPDGALAPDFAGIRPKLRGPRDDDDAQQQGDFAIRREAAGWISLYGIESPGLTSALAIGDYVARMVEDSS
ncbi:putative dehydrogenase [Tribonema minus]|uniref:L-2-hydroxyglutarate dehydrogenase, mitochondrial n=1 Tax=Tribonema minus TaxID=303371 RepID=A0A835YUY1_9STRA|nr:putative dehydrogenase [Tribonema minus]